MQQGWRSVFLTFLFFLGIAGCPDKVIEYDSLHIAVTSEVAVDEIRVSVRYGANNGTREVRSSALTPDAGLLITDFGGKDLTTQSYVLKVESSALASATVLVHGLKEGKFVCAYVGDVEIGSLE